METPNVMTNEAEQCGNTDATEPRSTANFKLQMSAMRDALLQLRAQKVDYNRSHATSEVYSTASHNTSHVVVPIEWSSNVNGSRPRTTTVNQSNIVARCMQSDHEEPSSCVCSFVMCLFVFGACVGTFTVPISILVVMSFCILPCVREDWKDNWFFSGMILDSGIGFVLAFALILVLKGLEFSGHI